MPTQFETAIVDTSCIILLNKIGELEILKKLFPNIVTTEDVSHEFGKSLPNWIKIHSIKDKKHKTLLELEVDEGEASIIALNLESGNSLLILDDLPARKLAQRLKQRYTGTLGVIARAKREGIIDSVKPIIEKIKNTNFRFSNEVFLEILKSAGEV